MKISDKAVSALKISWPGWRIEFSIEYQAVIPVGNSN